MTDQLYNHEAERAVIGSILLHPELFATVKESGVSRSSFHEGAYSRVFGAMTTVVAAGKKIDHVSLAGALRESDDLERVGGTIALTKLIDDTATSAHLDTYCKIVTEHELRRRLFMAAVQIQETVRNEPDSRVCVSESSEILQGASDGRLHSGGPRRTSEIVDQHCEYLFDDEDPKGLVKTGIEKIDNYCGGLWPMLTVMASRPGMGKSTVALNIAVNAANAGKKVLLISLEDTAQVVIWRMLARLAHIPLEEIFRKQFQGGDHERIITAKQLIASLPLYIEDGNLSTAGQIRDLCISHQIKHGVDLVIIDHLGHINEPGKNLYESTSKACRTIARLPGELGAPVLLLHQLNRQTVGTEEKLPRLEHLRQSGEIEQLARAVWLLHRPNYYDETKDPNEMALIIAKNSHGRTSTLKLYAEMKYIQISKSEISY